MAWLARIILANVIVFRYNLYTYSADCSVETEVRWHRPHDVRTTDGGPVDCTTSPLGSVPLVLSIHYKDHDPRGLAPLVGRVHYKDMFLGATLRIRALKHIGFG